MKQTQLPERRTSKRWRKLTIVREAGIHYAAYRRFMRLPADQKRGSPTPSELRATLVDLGPTFIKLGQILSTRPDFLPLEYIRSLEELQENVPPFSFDEVMEVFREEFGKEPLQMYGSFDQVPAASASLAQVHFAVLPDGSEVAVKVQRPDVRRGIMSDLDVLGSLLRLAELIAPKRVKRSNLRAAFEEFGRYTLQELDFRLEAQTMDRFRDNFAGWNDVAIPKVFLTYTSHRILTMERVSGMRLKQAVNALSMEQRTNVAKRLMEMEMKMFISDGVFHADLHPGNILFREDGSIALLDFGMFGELSEEEIDHFTLYWLAVVQRQVKRAFFHFTRMTRRLAGADEAVFFEKFSFLARRFYESRLSEMTITQVYFAMIVAGYRHGFVFPSHLMLHAKAITTAEALVFTLAPEVKAEELTRAAVKREFARRAGDLNRLAFRIGQIIPELLLTGEVLPPLARDAYVPGSDGGYSMPDFLDLMFAFAERAENANGPATLLRVLIDPFARSILSEYHGQREVESILAEAWRRFTEMEPDLPVLSKIGPTINIRLAGATMAMHEALLKAGHGNDEAVSIFRRIAWSVYEKMGQIPSLVATLLTTNPYGRMSIATHLFREFPFSSPDYRMMDVPSAEGTVGFDVIECPVAALFRSQGKGDLCQSTWCELDYPLAEKWGGKLERTMTIAGGALRCDFRWKTPPQCR